MANGKAGGLLAGLMINWKKYFGSKNLSIRSRPSLNKKIVQPKHNKTEPVSSYTRKELNEHQRKIDPQNLSMDSLRNMIDDLGKMTKTGLDEMNEKMKNLDEQFSKVLSDNDNIRKMVEAKNYELRNQTSI